MPVVLHATPRVTLLVIEYRDSLAIDVEREHATGPSRECFGRAASSLIGGPEACQRTRSINQSIDVGIVTAVQENTGAKQCRNVACRWGARFPLVILLEPGDRVVLRLARVPCRFGRELVRASLRQGGETWQKHFAASNPQRGLQLLWP